MEPVQDNEFMCRCSPEHAARCDEVRAAAMDHYGPPGDDGPTADHYEYLLFSLALDANLSIAADQWAGVHISTRQGQSSMFQCDRIIDGLAAAYLWLRQQPEFTSELD